MVGVGRARECVDCVGDVMGDGNVPVLLFGDSSAEFGPLVEVVPIVVLRTAVVVSDDGRGGRFATGIEDESRLVARQRKHSPVPK